MIVAIDGTGPEGDGDYEFDMRSSFCNQIVRQTPKSKYLRGPTNIGSETRVIALSAVNHILRAKPAKVMLAGYSRGGAAAIIAARELKAKNVAVHSLFLFDAVNMQASDTGGTWTIPDNVKYVAHARGERDMGHYATNPNRSRWYFINTGGELAGSGKYEMRKFVGTHGALGGTPWHDILFDRDCVGKVAAWMNGHMHKRGLKVTLTDQSFVNLTRRNIGGVDPKPDLKPAFNLR